MPTSPSPLQDLRARIAHIERGLTDTPWPAVSLSPLIDRHLPEGGLARGALHEVLAADPGAGVAFSASILGRLAGPVLWIAPTADAVWPPGLQTLGLCVSRLILVQYRQPAEGLWALEEALRSPALQGAVLQIPHLDLTAARRLQLATEATGSLGLLLRPATAAQGPSNALTRWRVAARPEPRARPAWQLDLLRCRGGQPGSWAVVGPELAAPP